MLSRDGLKPDSWIYKNLLKDRQILDIRNNLFFFYLLSRIKILINFYFRSNSKQAISTLAK